MPSMGRVSLVCVVGLVFGAAAAGCASGQDVAFEDFTDDELMTITDDDVTKSALPLLRGLGLTVPA